MKYSDVLAAQLEEDCRRELEGAGNRHSETLAGDKKEGLRSLCEEARSRLSEAERIFAAQYGDGDDRTEEARKKIEQLQL